MVLVFICVRHQRRLTVLLPGNEKLGCQSEVVLLQSLADFHLRIVVVLSGLVTACIQGSSVVLGGQMDIIAVSRLSSSQVVLLSWNIVVLSSSSLPWALLRCPITWELAISAA
ncbi:hypothetical protein Pelo_19868 [Pelomyxa schiedti]|nr:hypothetical protein Pelo_19868 [Pelomyxa schiedti]